MRSTGRVGFGGFSVYPAPLHAFAGHSPKCTFVVLDA